MTWWRVYSKARATRVALSGIYSGCSGFLVGGSPHLLDLDLRLMNLQGVWSLAINNAAMVFEPQAFICLDMPACFNYNIFSNPRIMKMVNYSRHDDMVCGKRLCNYPNTLFIDGQDEHEMTMSEFCRTDGPLPFWRNTFFTALAAMYQLGFSKVNLIGCTFDTSDGVYAHGDDPGDDSRQSNQIIYDDTVEKMRVLVPKLEDEGMFVRTCHPNTALDGICPYIPFTKALTEVVTDSTGIGYNKLVHSSQARP